MFVCLQIVTRLLMVIVVKCIEISNYYILYQELTKWCSPTILQKKPQKIQNKLIEKSSDSWLQGTRVGGKGNLMKVVKMYKLQL